MTGEHNWSSTSTQPNRLFPHIKAEKKKMNGCPLTPNLILPVRLRQSAKWGGEVKHRSQDWGKRAKDRARDCEAQRKRDERGKGSVRSVWNNYRLLVRVAEGKNQSIVRSNQRCLRQKSKVCLDHIHYLNFPHKHQGTLPALQLLTLCTQLCASGAVFAQQWERRLLLLLLRAKANIAQGGGQPVEWWDSVAHTGRGAQVLTCNYEPFIGHSQGTHRAQCTAA